MKRKYCWFCLYCYLNITRNMKDNHWRTEQNTSCVYVKEWRMIYGHLGIKVRRNDACGHESSPGIEQTPTYTRQFGRAPSFYESQILQIHMSIQISLLSLFCSSPTRHSRLQSDKCSQPYVAGAFIF